MSSSRCSTKYRLIEARSCFLFSGLSVMAMSRGVRHEAAPKQSASKQRKPLREQVAVIVWNLPVRCELIYEFWEDLREDRSGLAVGRAELRGQIAQPRIAERLRQLVGRHVGVRARADPRVRLLSQPAGAKLVDHARQSAVLLDHRHHRSQQIGSAFLMTRAKAIDQCVERTGSLRLTTTEHRSRDVAEDAIEESHGVAPSRIPNPESRIPESRSARRPGERTAREQVQVDVEDRLAGGTVGVEHGPVAVVGVSVL